MLYIFAHFTKFMLFYIHKDKRNLYIVDICNEITKVYYTEAVSQKKITKHTQKVRLGKIKYTYIFKLILFIILM